MNLRPFHLAVQVRNIHEAREFYGDLLGCCEGRSDKSWVDFELYGHQLVCHLNPNLGSNGKVDLFYNSVDKNVVSIPHYGVIMEMNQWTAFVDRLAQHKVDLLIEPTIRFRGKIGEQATVFFLDPSGNALEFKAFQDISRLFA